MSSFTFTPHLHTPPITPKPKPKPKSKLKPTKTTLSLQATTTTPQFTTTSTFTDPFVLQLAETLEDYLPSLSPSSPLQTLKDTSSQTLLSTPWPSRKDEPFRFTDTSFIKNSHITPISQPQQSTALFDDLKDTHFNNLVFIDGFVVNSVSNLSTLPDGVYVGSLLGLSNERIFKRVCEFVSDFQWGDLFWSINGLGAPDLAVVYVPEGCKVQNPIHLRYFAVEGGDEGSKKLPVSNPRVIVVVEKGGEVGIMEEFVGKQGSEFYWANSVLEVVVGEGAKVRHSYVQNQSMSAAHIKWSCVRQVNS